MVKKEKKSRYNISGPMETLDKKGKKIDLENEGTKFVVILLCIVAFIAILWLVSVLKDNKIEEESNESKTVSINYNEVIVGNMLDQKYDSYLVYAYNEDDNDSTVEYLLISAGHYYKLDLSKANNLPATAETSNFKGTIDQIKFKGTTLLIIEKGKITKYYEGNDAIKEYLKNLKK